MNRNGIYDLSDYESSSIEEDLVSRNSSTSCSLSADLTDEADKTTTGTAGGFDTDRAAALIQRTYRRRRHAGNTSNITSVNGNVAVAAVSNHLVDEASPAVRNATLDSADGEDADAPNIIEATDRENTEHTEEGSERSISEATGLLDTKEKEQEEEEKPIEKSHHWKIAAIAGTFIGAMSLGLKALQTDSPVDEDDLVAAVALFKGAGGIAGGAGGGGAGGAAAGGGTSAIAAAGGGGGAGGAAAAATSGGGVGGTAAGGGAANVAQMQQALQTMAVAASQNAANSVAAGAGAAANPAAAAAAAASSGASSTTVVAATVVAVTAAAVTTGVTVSSRESRSAAEAVRYCPGIAEFDVLPGRVDIDFLGMNDTLSFDEAGLMEDLFTEAYHSVMGNCTGEYKRLIVETVVSCNSEDQCCERVNTVFGEVTRCQFNTEVHCVGCWSREPMFLDSTELESLESDPTTDEGLARSLLGIMKHRSQPKMFASSQDFGDAWVRSLQSPESLVMIEAVVDAIASGCKALQVCDPDISAENQISQVRLFDMERQAYFEAINFLTPPTSAPIQQEISLTSLPSSVLVASRTPSSTGPTRSTTGAPTLLQSVSIMEPSSSTSSQITSSPLDLMPSSAPISSPGLTLTPTDISLEAPTFIPVVSPTPVPIAGITPSPSGVSAPFPTKVPTAAPTGVSTTNMSSPPSLMESSIQPVESPFFPSISLTNVPIEDSTLPSIETRIPTESFGPTQEITQAPGENASPISVNLPTALSSSSPFIPQPGLSSFDPVAAPSTNPSDIASLPPGAFPNTTPTTAPITSLLLPPTAAPSLRTTAPRLETESDAPMTESPSTIPEMVPSRNPSMQPPNVLSLVPMDPQSSSPPQGSTAFPSAQGDNPSRNPTNQLTNAPANIFPGFPTIAPTSLPTTGQTREPADPSTAEPTSLPSTFATDQPASPPPPKSSNVPIEVSSSSPVSRPTLSPVLLPTFLPTVSETIPPRGLPSSSPVAYQPTQFPLSSSTYTPTVSPARQATLNPTGNPTILLTMPPTVFPTDTSTESVTEAPTKFPTQGPTTKSIFSSTSDPTLFPTLPPTDQVTKSPTLNPTSGPTSSLTLSPPDQPTLSPTIEPSLPPIVPPTNSPTVAPSLSPTRQPTVAPTADPTAPPTPFPTYQPTGFPTLAPTKRPTSAPTPSPTERPTLSPTEEPTAIPTLLPTVLPTVQPTVSPTIFPTERPTRPPTNKPTAAPTSPPTLPPTSIPSRKPVDYIQCDDTENYVPCRGDDGFVVCLDDRAGIGVPVCLCKPGTGGCLFYMNTFPRDRMKCGYCPKETISCRYSEFSCANRRWNSCQISNKESVCSRKTSFPSKNRYCGNCDGSFN